MESDEITRRLQTAAQQGKMDAMRAQLDAQSGFIPQKYEPTDAEVDSVIRDEAGSSVTEQNPIKDQITKLYSKKMGIDANMQLAKQIIDLNPDLPKAFKAKFEVMAINAHFATNVQVVIADCYKHKIKLKMSEGGKSPKRLKKVGE